MERYRDSVMLALPPHECLDRAEAFLAGRGFTVEHRDSRTLAVSRHAMPDPWVGLVLLLFVVPGLAYFALAPRRKASTTVLAVPEGGVTELSYSSQGFRSRRAVGELFGELSGEKEPRRR